MLKFVFYLSIFAAVNHLIEGLDVQCKDVKKVRNFSYAKAGAIWVKYAATPPLNEGKIKCKRDVIYQLIDDEELPIGHHWADTTIPDSDLKSSLDIWTASGLGIPDGTTPSQSYYGFLSTDYTAYAIMFFCSSPDSNEIDSVSVLTRHISPSDETISKINDELQKIDMNLKDLQETNQDSCPPI